MGLRAIRFCILNNLPFRGTDDHISIDFNSHQGYISVFKESIKFLCSSDKSFKNQLESAPKNASYLSPNIQNQCIDIIGSLITNKIVLDIGNSPYAILFDETTDISCCEQMSIVVRYFDSNCNMQERLLKFVDCYKNLPENEFSLSGKNIGAIVEKEMRKIGLNILNCVGFGTDGASVMTSSEIGAVSCLKKSAKNSVHIICLAHCLNLSIGKGCGITEIQSVISTIKEIYDFFNSPKRCHIFQAVNKKTTSDRVKNLCMTRWIERINSINSFIDEFKNIYDALCFIISEKFDSNMIAKSSELKTKMESSSFLIGLVTTRYLMTEFKQLSKILQSKSIHLVEALKEANRVIILLEKKLNIQNFREIFDNAKDIAFSIGQTLSRSRNTEDPNKINFWFENLFRPSIQLAIDDLKSRIGKSENTFALLTYLLPSNLNKLTPEILKEIFDFYHPLLESNNIECTFDNFRREVDGYKLMEIETDEIPIILKSTLGYEIVSFLLRVLIVLPCSTATAERTFSFLKRCKTPLRNRTGQERLSGLAVGNLNADIFPEIGEIMKTF